MVNAPKFFKLLFNVSNGDKQALKDFTDIAIALFRDYKGQFQLLKIIKHIASGAKDKIIQYVKNILKMFIALGVANVKKVDTELAEFLENFTPDLIDAVSQWIEGIMRLLDKDVALRDP